ncbi:MAG TPA: hypothetical protein VFY84_05580 [Jiangellales bacterium]|nr:hypothetical protein [Jiangellales bacterium]
MEVASAQVRVTASDQTDTVLVEPINECDLRMASGRVQLDRINALQANIASR